MRFPKGGRLGKRDPEFSKKMGHGFRLSFGRYNSYHVAGFAGRLSDAVGGDMVEFTKTIKDPLGLHARPVALLYDIVAKHRSDVSVSIGDRHTDGRDVMGLMALYGECGEDIIFRVSGVDEASCVTSIRNLSL